MSRGNKWIALDKYLASEFKYIRREFSLIEAMFSYTLDQDKGNKWSISGYSKLWGWSRNKVRKFVESIGTEAGHIRDRKRTQDGHPIHFIDIGLACKQDTKRTEPGQVEDSKHDSTSKPNPKPKTKDTPIVPKKKKPKKKFIPPTIEEVENYFLENKYTKESGNKAWKYYDAGDWKDSRNNQVKNWKQKMRGVWFKKENKINGKGEFEGKVYEGTPEEDITWLND